MKEHYLRFIEHRSTVMALQIGHSFSKLYAFIEKKTHCKQISWVETWREILTESNHSKLKITIRQLLGSDQHVVKRKVNKIDELFPNFVA